MRFISKINKKCYLKVKLYNLLSLIKVQYKNSKTPVNWDGLQTYKPFVQSFHEIEKILVVLGHTKDFTVVLSHQSIYLKAKKLLFIHSPLICFCVINFVNNKRNQTKTMRSQ